MTFSENTYDNKNIVTKVYVIAIGLICLAAVSIKSAYESIVKPVTHSYE